MVLGLGGVVVVKHVVPVIPIDNGVKHNLMEVKVVLATLKFVIIIMSVDNRADGYGVVGRPVMKNVGQVNKSEIKYVTLDETKTVQQTGISYNTCWIDGLKI